MGILVCPEDNLQAVPVHRPIPVLNEPLSWVENPAFPSRDCQGLLAAKLSKLYAGKMLVNSCSCRCRNGHVGQIFSKYVR